MEENFLQIVTIFIPTVGLLALLFNKKINQNTRKIILWTLPLWIGLDGFMVYKIISKSSVESAPSRNANLVKACQEMQKPILREQGVAEEKLETATMPVCNCIADALREYANYNEIEKIVDQGGTFTSLLSSHRESLLEAMKKCAK